MKESILVFAAHADDEVLGCGGTINKYSDEGKEVIIVVFTSGEHSSPWLKKEVLVETRIREEEKIGKFLGAKEVINLGFPDGKLKDLISKKKVKDKVKKIILKYKPKQIFTHSKKDAHASGDHKAVSLITLDVLKEIDPKKKISAFVYEVWNLRNQVMPRHYVDISKYFDKKIKAMKMFKSQWLWIHILIIPVFVRNWISGLHIGSQYAERFYKIR